MKLGLLFASCLLLAMVASSSAARSKSGIPILPPSMQDTQSHRHAANQAEPSRVAGSAQPGLENFLLPDDDDVLPVASHTEQPRFAERFDDEEAQQQQEDVDSGLALSPGAALAYANDMEADSMPSLEERQRRARNSPDQFDSNIAAEDRFQQVPQHEEFEGEQEQEQEQQQQQHHHVDESDLERFVDTELKTLSTATADQKAASAALAATIASAAQKAKQQAATHADQVAGTTNTTTTTTTTTNTTSPVTQTTTRYNRTWNSTTNYTKPTIVSADPLSVDNVSTRENLNCYLWSPRKSTRSNPDARENHFIWTAPNRDTVYLYGGCAEGNHPQPLCHSTLNSWNMTSLSWTETPIATQSAAKMKSVGAAFCVDAAGTVWEYGGKREQEEVTGSRPLALLASLSQTGGEWKWVIKPTSGVTVPALSDATMSCVDNYLILFGGYTENGTYSNEIYYTTTDGPNAFQFFSGRISGVAPRPRSGHTAVQADAKTLIVFGGSDGAKALSDIYQLTIPSYPISSLTTFAWATIRPGGNSAIRPSPRAYHSATVIPNGKMVVFGGLDAQGNAVNTFHVYSFASRAWLPLPNSLFGSASLAMPARNRHATTIAGKDNDQVVLIGGCTKGIDSQCSDVWAPTVLDTNGVCPDRCGSFGKYTLDTSLRAQNINLDRPVCTCIAGYAGKFCETKLQCPDDCSGHGECIGGSCACTLGWGGENCARMVCPNNCNNEFGQGYCSSSSLRCICHPDFWGLDCSERACLPYNCMGRGICQRKASAAGNTCKCKEPFSGPNCEYFALDTAPPNNNTVNGVGAPVVPPLTVSFRELLDINVTTTNSTSVPPAAPTTTAAPPTQFKFADLFPNSTTPLPERPIYLQDFSCPRNCSGHGICKRTITPGGQVWGVCECEEGFGGADCGGECTLYCSGKGRCVGADRYSVYCKCKPGRRGLGCFESYCHNGCSGHGLCSNNSCFCETGYGGPGCSVDTTCMGRGKYDVVKERCECGALSAMEGYTGVSCNETISCAAFGGCGVHGSCAGKFDWKQKAWVPYCKCEDGWGGDKCTNKACPADCTGNGLCLTTGQCACYSGYAGDNCNTTLLCPNNCTVTHGISHGRCVPDLSVAINMLLPNNQGTCKCNEGWAGPACDQIGCKAECYGRGSCQEGRCYCKNGYAGDSCQFQCPNYCSNHGTCVGNGTCVCHPGFSGEDCGIAPVCPSLNGVECAGRGVCFKHTGTCFCNPGATGSNCAEDSKCGDQGCVHGVCKNGKCHCDPGYEGLHCEEKTSCQNDCSNKGFCMRGKCFCYTGFTGESCDQFITDITCKNNCSSTGVCQFGRCFCAPGFTGEDCSIPKDEDQCLITKDATVKCSGKGMCKYAKCFCNPGWAGSHCQEREQCPYGCVDKQGICMGQTCYCLPGFKGPDCSEAEVCPGSPPCRNNGMCIRGKCACMPYYSGDDCSKLTIPSITNLTCPNDCSGAGVCHMGRCFCVDGFTGSSCEIKTQNSCPFGCSDKGMCRFGECFCKPGFVGKGCEVAVTCDRACMRNGVCAFGRCFCAAGWRGKNCNIPADYDRTMKMLEDDLIYADSVARTLRARNASSNYCEGGCNRGICVNNSCFCQSGFAGRHCERVLPTAVLASRCGNNCSGNGTCIFGKCFCYPGFGGEICDSVQPLLCPENCNSHGICSLGRCSCDPGFSGASCNITDPGAGCDPACALGGHGVCIQGFCQCSPGFSGKNCEIQDGAAVMKFRSIDKPEAASELSGLIGQTNKCELECGANGVCVGTQCYCRPGYTGSDCSKLESSLTAEGMSLDDTTGVPEQHKITNSMATDATPALTPSSGSIPYVLLSALSFIGGVVVCIVVQLAYARYKAAEGKKKVNEIFRPLVNSASEM